MENSFWKIRETAIYPALREDIETDVAIIGGGLAGIMCAYELLTRGHRVSIFEKGIIGSGESGRSSAMVSFSHDLIYKRLIKKHGEETAKQYLDLANYGIEKIKDIIKTNNIDCNYNDCSMYLYSTTKKGKKDIYKEKQAYDTLGVKTEITTITELPFPVSAALKIDGQGYLNPAEFLYGVLDAVEKAGGKIYENTMITSQPENNVLVFEGYKIKAEHFVIATHYPYLNFPGFYFTKMFQSRSHNIVFNSGLELKNIYESAEDDGFEYRPVNGGILCGGAHIRTGNYKHRSQYKIVEENIGNIFGTAQEDIVARFAAQDCITFDMLPFVGGYSGFLENVYVISGFNKWGFSTSAASSRIIADTIEKRNTDKSRNRESRAGLHAHDRDDADLQSLDYYNIFHPKRLYLLKSPVKSVKNIGKLLASFAELIINSDAKKIKRIQPGQGAVVKLKGKRLGVYKDENGRLKTIAAVCPHLGCALKWNKDEKTWDCPCHGSRYDVEGKILSNPTIKCAEKVNIGNPKAE